MTSFVTESVDDRIEVAPLSSNYMLAVGLGLVHACVDATTVTVVFRAVNLHDLTPTIAFAIVLGYDLIAFGSQVVLGMGADRWKAQGVATRLGLCFSAVSVVCIRGHLLLAMLLAGFGNALFHMGAGGLVLGRGTDRSALSGIFVAPGALGLAFGLTYGKLIDLGPVWPLAVLLGLSLVATWHWTRRAAVEAPAHTEVSRGGAAENATSERLLWRILALLLLSVAVRSLVGFSAARGITPNEWLYFGVPIGAFVGKALGGVIADRFGWLEITLLALVASAPCIVFGFQHTAVLLCGLCLFQMTMPVTLAAVARLMPRRLSTAFGWTCVALIIGALPSMFTATRTLCARPMLAVWIALACVSVTLGLRLLGIEFKLHRQWRQNPYHREGRS